MELSVQRYLNPRTLLAKKPHFLFGSRQTGKTHLIRETLGDIRISDLLDAAVFAALSRNPGRIGEEIEGRSASVIVDQVQRLPALLHEVHRLIETRGFRFLLMGSSPRKLRRGGVNLLGGPARTKYLHPFSWRELSDRYDLTRAARHGLLPPIYLSDDPQADLQAYTGSYLQEEIVAEGAPRNIPAFTGFLHVAAQANGTVVNFTNIANDAQVPRTTVYEYVEILKDTLILYELPAWKLSRKRKPLVSSKYYFFDIGVVGSLQGRRYRDSSNRRIHGRVVGRNIPVGRRRPVFNLGR